MKCRLTLGALFAVSSILLNSGKAHSQVIVNPGFETPPIAAAIPLNYVYNPSGATWSFVSGSGIAGNGSAFMNANAPQGTQVAFVQDSGDISQSISGFQSGAMVTFSFSAAQRPTNGAIGGNNPFNVLLDNTVLLSNVLPSSTSFSEFTTGPVTTTAGAHTLRFLGLGSTTADNTVFIDNVRITVTPEPGSVALLVSGSLCGAGLLLRRRK